MSNISQWHREAGVRLEGSRPLDSSKVQAPCIVAIPTGGYRLFYTAVGPAKPFAACQGYILSAFSEEGLTFQTEPGIRLAPQQSVPHMSRRVLAPTISRCVDGRWRMYFESRGTAELPTVICSAISCDMLHWEHEEGIRLQGFQGVGGPRYHTLPDGRGRIFIFGTEIVSNSFGNQTNTYSQSVASAVTSDGLDFILEPGYRLKDKQTEYDTAGITAAEAIPPHSTNGHWTMFFSVWQDAPVNSIVPLHPSRNSNAELGGFSDDFAKASIASDMSGYRSRIYFATSPDGLNWERGVCVVEGNGYGNEGLDAVHAEDMSLIKLGSGEYRMYYAACDKSGIWRIVSAVTKTKA